MSVLTRSSLEESPLADLHVLAAELGLPGYRKLRKADLVGAILEAQPGGAPADDEASDDDAPKRTRRRGGRTRGRSEDDDGTARLSSVPDDDDGDADDDKPARRRSRGGRSRGNGGNGGDGGGRNGRSEPESEESVEVSGVVEVLGNGSAFLRVSPPEPSDDDVYVSAAQVRRCELVSGDEIAGPVRAPRRSERYPSLVRIDTINGRPAEEVAEGTPWDQLPCAFPSERFALGSEDPTLKAIEWLTPVGRGSRVTICGAPRAGKSEALRLLAGALAAQDGLELSLVYVGVRPEELREVPEGLTPAASLGLGTGAEALGQAVERAVDTAKRVAARGGHAVVLVDTLDRVPETVARRALAAARAIVDGGSLTVVATATEPLGGETTVIALDATQTSTGRLPALDLVSSGTLKPELLVGAAGAQAIADARSAALG